MFKNLDFIELQNEALEVNKKEEEININKKNIRPEKELKLFKKVEQVENNLLKFK